MPTTATRKRHGPSVAQGWTYATDGNDAVLWYCSPDGERCGNKPQLQRHWRNKHGHTNVPAYFNFKAKDVPPYHTMVHVERDSEEDREEQQEEEVGYIRSGGGVGVGGASETRLRDCCAGVSATPRRRGIGGEGSPELGWRSAGRSSMSPPLTAGKVSDVMIWSKDTVGRSDGLFY